ncbi:MAG: hypothetical protein JWO31_2992 [Phycisphaerales bacterium]|nr:hypothetical protein [Phycisphaerales bacterium]
MHALGHRDVVTAVAADATDAWALCHGFNATVWRSGRAIADGDAVGGEPAGGAYRVRAEPCTRHPPDSLYHNPYGMWRIVRAEAFPPQP